MSVSQESNYIVYSFFQEAEMRSAFNALDREGGGYILEAELRGLLASLGDSLNSSEVIPLFFLLIILIIHTPKVDAVMRAAKVGSGGEVFYDDFINNLCK
jgi:hypothetical protein